MRLAAVALFALTFGILGGVWSAWALLDREIAVSHYVDGPWVATPGAYRADANPYARARRAQRPLFGFDGAETISFVARTDSEGLRLTPACHYRMSGSRLPARRWTLAVLPTAAGRGTAPDLPEGAPPIRAAFTSSELLRAEDQSYQIALSRRPSPGNWLPTRQPYALALNLYDTTLLSGITQERASLPSLERIDCSR